MHIALGFPLAILTMLMFGVGGVTSGLLGKRYNGVQALFLFQLFGIPLILPFIFTSYFGHISFGNIATLLLLGIFDSVIWLIFFKAMSIGKISIMNAIINAYMVVTLILSTIFFHTSLTLLTIIALCLTFVGITLMTSDISDIRTLFVKKNTPGTGFALLSMLGIGIYMTGVGGVSAHAGWVQTILFIRCAITLTAGGILAYRKSFPKISSIPWKLIAIAAAVDVIAFSLFNVTLQFMSVSNLTMITSCSTLVTLAVMYIKYKENIKAQQIFGIIITTSALILLSKV